jgi:hypothetical protein
MATPTFERRFNAGFYPILDGRVIGENGIGQQTLDAAVAEFFALSTFPGCYPLVYITASGDELCGDCARKDWEEADLVAIAQVVSEASHDITCEECNREIAPQNICSEHGADGYDDSDGYFRCLICEQRDN